jgi:Fic family protein
MSELQDTLKQILEKLQSLETRMERFEQMQSSTQQQIQPSLARILKNLKDIGEATDAEEVALRSGLARNRASAYLNELSSIGYVDKKPNLGKSNARYLFKYNPEKIPLSIRELIE